MSYKYICIGVVISLLSACTANESYNALESKAKKKLNYKKLADSFFTLYSKRNDFDAFMSFYAENAVLEDLVFGDYVESKPRIRAFYKWDANEVELLEDTGLVILEQIIDKNRVVTRGYFTRFHYHHQIMGPWRFIIWLEFDEKGKITKQYDWINYTPKENFIGGDNLNLLITKP